MPIALRSICTLVALLACAQLSCGKGPTVIDIDLPVNQASPFDELLNTPAASIFFQFDPLSSNATSINDITGIGGITFPTDTGFQPNSTSFDISQVPIDDNTAYRVTVLGSIDGLFSLNAKYRGVADCPLIKRLGEDNVLNVCFGLSTLTAVCVDTTPFANCPN